MNRTLVIGVGGAGCNLAEEFGRSPGCDVLLVNLSHELTGRAMQPNLCLPADSRSGCLPTVLTAEKAAEEVADRFGDILKGKQYAVISVGLGGVTGSGAAPVLARIARSLGVHVTAIATLPFSFEIQRKTVSEAALCKLRNEADALIVHDHATASSSRAFSNGSLEDYFCWVAKELSQRLGGCASPRNGLPGTDQ